MVIMPQRCRLSTEAIEYELYLTQCLQLVSLQYDLGLQSPIPATVLQYENVLSLVYSPSFPIWGNFQLGSNTDRQAEFTSPRYKYNSSGYPESLQGQSMSCSINKLLQIRLCGHPS